MFNRKYKLKPFYMFFVSGGIATYCIALCKINCIFRGIKSTELFIYAH